MRLLLLIVMLSLLLGSGAMAQDLPILDDGGEVSEQLLETLLYPGEFPGRRFTYISEGDEAQYCLDSSLSASEPFAQVYPERIVWPKIGGVELVVEKLDLKLIPQGEWVTDEALDKGFAIRWHLEVLGQDFSRSPAFRMRAVGAEVFSMADARVLMHWASPEAPELCTASPEPGHPDCHLQGVSLEAQAVAVSPDATLAAVAFTGLKPRIEMYDITDEPRLRWQSTFPVTSGGALEVGFSADGRFVVALLGNGRIHRFDAVSGGAHLPIPATGRVATTIPPGRTVAVAGDGGEVVLWRLVDGTIDWRIAPRKTRGTVDKLTVSGDGKRIATLEYADGQTVVRIWEIRRRRALAQLDIPGTEFVDVAFDEEGSRLFLSHETQGLFFVSLKERGAPVPFGEKATMCTGKIQWVTGTGKLGCAVENGIVHVGDEGAVTGRLKTKAVSNRWLTATSPGGTTTVAVGSGHLLIWR